MDQKITFRASKGYLKFEADYPKPVKTNIPEWFKKLDHNMDTITVKGCIPFLQSLTTGYLLSLPQDFRLEHNSLDKESLLTNLTASFPENNFNLNSKGRKESHDTYQVKGSPALLDTKLKKGTPYVQVIPFKRDSWKMKIEETVESEKMWIGKYFLKTLHNYKETFWNKNTTWK